MSLLEKKYTKLAVTVLILFAFPGYAAASIKAGQAIVKEKCLVCHNIAGDGMVMASDLAISYKEHDKAWSRKMIAQPSKMLAQDPIAKELLVKYNNVAMPDLGLSEEELDNIIDFLDALIAGKLDQASDCAGEEAAPEEHEPVLEGDAAIGEQLFTGELAFHNRASSCMACHNSGAGFLGGGNYGTDLSEAYQRYKDGFPKVLKQLPFPSMTAIYQNKELTPEERYHLTAYFKKISESQTPEQNDTETEQAKTELDQNGLLFAGMSLGGLLLLYLLITSLLPQRNKGVREELLEKVKKNK